MPRLDRLPQLNRNNLLMLPVQVNDTAPFTPLKALYFEGRLAMKPGATGDDVTRWFGAETAAGQLLRRVRERLDASVDPRWKAAAFGVAR
jgi:hypothetical protein